MVAYKSHDMLWERHTNHVKDLKDKAKKRMGSKTKLTDLVKCLCLVPVETNPSTARHVDDILKELKNGITHSSNGAHDKITWDVFESKLENEQTSTSHSAPIQKLCMLIALAKATKSPDDSIKRIAETLLEYVANKESVTQDGLRFLEKHPWKVSNSF